MGSVHELDLAKLETLSNAKEIAITVIDELIFRDLAEKCDFFATAMCCRTNAKSQDELTREQINDIAIVMLTAAQTLFIDKEREVLNQMDESPVGKLSKKAGAVALETLSQISFTSKPENIHELTNAPACLH